MFTVSVDKKLTTIKDSIYWFIRIYIDGIYRQSLAKETWNSQYKDFEKFMKFKVDQDKLILVRWTLISANEDLLCSLVNRLQKAARSDYFKGKQLILTNFK